MAELCLLKGFQEQFSNDKVEWRESADDHSKNRGYRTLLYIPIVTPTWVSSSKNAKILLSFLFSHPSSLPRSPRIPAFVE